jgi:hypothetical protein
MASVLLYNVVPFSASNDQLGKQGSVPTLLSAIKGNAYKLSFDSKGAYVTDGAPAQQDASCRGIAGSSHCHNHLQHSMLPPAAGHACALLGKNLEP